MRLLAMLWLAGLCWIAPLEAQLIAAKEAEVAMGHYHLNVTDIEAHKRFWGDLLGAKAAKFGNTDVMKFPDALIFLRKQAPTGGTIGSSIDHIGLHMPDVPAMVAKLRAAGVPVVTKAEITGGRAKGDIFFSPSQMTYLAYVMSPDGVKIELVENRSLEMPIANHHIHFYTPEVEKLKSWHVQSFGSVAGRRGPFEESVLPGVRLTYTPTKTLLPGTKGRVLDHIGFEIKNLKAFCKKLEAQGVKFDRPYQELPKMNLGLAFLTDAWGNYIELTEGLDKL